MLREGSPIGAITVWRSAVGPFADKHIALLQTFADQAVIAVENVRLFKELRGRQPAIWRESLEQQTATGDILRAIASADRRAAGVRRRRRQRDPARRRASRAACRQYDGELVRRRRAYGDGMRQRGAWSYGAESVPSDRGERRWGGRILARRTQHDPRCVDGRVPRSECAQTPIRGRTVLAGAAAAGRRGRRDDFGVASSRSRSLPRQIEIVLQTFADQAVIAIENARLLARAAGAHGRAAALGRTAHRARRGRAGGQPRRSTSRRC